MTDAARYRLVATLFAELCDQPAETQRRTLQARHPDDPGLRDDVLDLLRRDATAGGSLEPRTASEATRVSLARDLRPETEAACPDRIGGFQILGRLGEGGMGAVYEARQSSPARTVALKVIAPGLAAPALLARFRREADALGRLDHPGIAHIYEAGTARDGTGERPYFAMELVRGRPIHEHAAAAGLGPRQRIELVARVCDALHHAHQKGVIHRDLKPANILAVPPEPHTADRIGQPKIVDFGVARLVGPGDPSGPRTEPGVPLGTRAYMSPEQAGDDPEDVDVRSDLWSMGVILHELLAGVRPESGRVARGRGDLVGDVASIVATTLETDRERRYASAAALAEDLRRTLRSEPILARPPTRRYLAARFVRRHRVLVAMSGLLLATLVAGAVGTTVGLLRAHARERRAEAAIESLLSVMHDARYDSDGSGRTVLQRIPDSMHALAGLSDRPALATGLLMEAGGLLAGEGLVGEAVPMLERAHTLATDAFGPDDPLTLEAAATLFAARVSDGTIADRIPELEATLRRAEATLGPDHFTTVRLLMQAALADIGSGRAVAAERRLRDQAARLDAWTSLLEPVLVLAVLKQGRAVDALDLARDLDRRMTQSPFASPIHHWTIQRYLAGALIELGAFGEAETRLHRILEGELVYPNRAVPEITMQSLGVALREQGRYAEAAAHLELALAIHRHRRGSDSRAVMDVRLTVANLLWHRGQSAEAVREATAVARWLEDHPDGSGRRHAECAVILGLAALREGRLDDARERLSAALFRWRDQLPGDHWRVVHTEAALAAVAAARGPDAEACAVLARAAERLLARGGDADPWAREVVAWRDAAAGAGTAR